MPRKITFKQLIAKYSIEIPRIQRDYAQGRLSQKATEIRRSIIDTIVNVLNDDNRTKDFNFIYGSANNSNTFIPLDGQQRLTTFFLLHLYLQSICNPTEDINYRFTYTTRKSSETFCQLLITNRPSVMAEIRRQYGIYAQRESAREIKDRKEREDRLKSLVLHTPGEIIRNQSWYITQWDADPTVAGMLVMLDEIHSRYISDITKAQKAYKRLFDDDAITFQFQSLEGFTRTDDLFIKMNSRGLGLTDFEIFKSKIVEDYEKKVPDLARIFKNNIDREWADFLWRRLRASITGCPGVKEGKTVNNIDIVFERLLKFLIPVEAAALGQKGINNFADELFERNGKTMRFAHNQYLKKDVVFDDNLLSALYKDFKYLLDASTSLLNNELLAGSKYFKDVTNPILSLLRDGYQATYPDTVLAYAMLRFGVLNIDNTQRETWTRTIYHIIRDSNVDSATGLINAIYSVNILAESLAKANVDVYNWLATATDIPDKLTGISNYQLQEEIAKAKLRQIATPDWSAAISKAEDDAYLEGQIGSLLEFAGIAENKESFALVSNVNLNDGYNKFISYFEKAAAIFDTFTTPELLISNQLLVRAMSRQGDYLIENGARRNTANRVSDRDYDWHALLNPGRNHHGRIKFKQLLDNVDFDKDNLVDSLLKIANKPIEVQPEWLEILAGEYSNDILSRSSGFLHYDNFDNPTAPNIRVLHTTQLNGFHDELYSLYAYLRATNEGATGIGYKSVKSGQMDAGITVPLNDENPDDYLLITHWNDEWRFIKDDQIIERIDVTTEQIVEWLKDGTIASKYRTAQSDTQS